MGECIRCMTTRPLIIQWSQKILIIDIIISRKLLWDQRPQTIRILHEWNTKTTLFQSKRVLVRELLTYSQITKSPNTNNTNRSNLTYLNTIWTLLLKWINFNPSIDKLSHELKLLISCPNFNSAIVEVWEWISNFIPHFVIDMIIYP